MKKDQNSRFQLTPKAEELVAKSEERANHRRQLRQNISETVVRVIRNSELRKASRLPHAVPHKRYTPTTADGFLVFDRATDVPMRVFRQSEHWLSTTI